MGDNVVALVDVMLQNSSALHDFLNITSSPTLSPSHKYTPYWLRWDTYLVPVIFVFIFVIGVVGNGTLILIFLRHRKMRNVPNIYIFSLAVGDLLVILSCVPFISTIYTFESWPWGETICKLSETSKDISVGVSVFTLTALSVERYYAIVQPMSRLMSTKSLAVLTSAVIWMVSFLFAAPALFLSHCQTTFILEKNENITFCTPFIHRSHGKVMVTLQFFIYYFIPILIIAIFYSMMARHLVLSVKALPGEHGKAKTQNCQILARRRVAFMVLAFVIIFIICFFPQRTFMLWFYYNPNSQSEYNWFWHVFRISGFCLAFLNSCVNPVALYLISNVFRKYFNFYLMGCPQSQLEQLRFPTFKSSISRRRNSFLLTTSVKDG